MQPLQRFLLIAAGFVMFVFVLFAGNNLLIHAQVEDDGIRAAVVQLTSGQVSPTEGTVIRAFVPTGSVNPVCLTTFAESPNAAFTGNTMFCAPRQPVGLGKGVLVSIFFPVVPPSDAAISVTVFQKGASHYGAPVLCNVAGCGVPGAP